MTKKEQAWFFERHSVWHKAREKGQPPKKEPDLSIYKQIYTVGPLGFWIRREEGCLYLLDERDFDTNHANTFLQAFLQTFHPDAFITYTVLRYSTDIGDPNAYAQSLIVRATGVVYRASTVWTEDMCSDLEDLGLSRLKVTE
jgi:hypothetical protein